MGSGADPQTLPTAATTPIFPLQLPSYRLGSPLCSALGSNPPLFNKTLSLLTGPFDLLSISNAGGALPQSLALECS